LIVFSNQAFYNGQLEAPPSRFSSQSDDRPIVYHDVGGLYANRTNSQEAGKVVQLLKDFWAREGPSPTIGVVTFNQPQRELIEDLIESECQRDEAFEARYAQERARKEDNQDVGFFVKNLENVQGDERDVMIFSTTFGRDSSGRFFRRFGPVGAKGGERRLNVAVTRAKRKVILVGSMPIEEISDALQAGNTPGTGITPAGYLQLYLAYAQAVSAGNRDKRDKILDLLKRQSALPQPGGEPESPFEEEVSHSLQKLGYQVHSQIGESGFRIDLAVLHPDPSRGFVLGIECDGASYHSDRSARIRDVWREKILRKRGWRLHRIWSTAWWYQRADEMEKLQNALADALMQELPGQSPDASDSQSRKPANHVEAVGDGDSPDLVTQECSAVESGNGKPVNGVPSEKGDTAESREAQENNRPETVSPMEFELPKAGDNSWSDATPGCTSHPFPRVLNYERKDTGQGRRWGSHGRGGSQALGESRATPEGLAVL
jgi:primosomal replication protein N''